MKINFEEHTSGGFLFWQNDSITKKQESAEDYLANQRENGLNPSKPDGSETRNYNDQESINEALFEYADTDGDGKINEKEYKTFLMKSVSDGTIGKETYTPMSGITQTGMNSLNESNLIIADYESLVRVADMYSALLDADSGIDENNDGVLTKEEFSTSVALKLMTEPETRELLYANKDSVAESKKIKIMSKLSSGVVGNLYSVLDFKYALDYLSGQYDMCYVPRQVIDPDYASLVDIADKYRQEV